MDKKKPKQPPKKTLGKKSLIVPKKFSASASGGSDIDGLSAPAGEEGATKKKADGTFSHPIRESLMISISRIFEERGWTQKQAAEFLGVTQPRISDLSRARVENFTIDLLVDWLGLLGHVVSLQAKEESTLKNTILKRLAPAEDAIPFYTKAITIDPLSASSYIRRGEAYVAQGKLDLAVGDFTRGLEFASDRPDWRLLRADAFVQQGQYRAAIFDCETVLKQGESAQRSWAPELFSVQSQSEVEKELRWWAYLCLGRACEGDGRDDDALKAYSTSISTAPEFGQAYHHRARLFERQEQIELAMKDYSHAIDCDPGDVPSSDRLAELKRKSQGQSAVTNEFDELTRLTKEFEATTTPARKAHILRNRAEVYQSKSEFALAIADFIRAIELDPSQDWLWANVAYCKYMNGDFLGVLQDCDKVIKSKFAPTDQSGAHMYKGWALEKLGMKNEALSCYDAGLVRNPQDPSLRWARGILLEAIGKSNEALSDYRETIYLATHEQSVAPEYVEQVKEYMKRLELKMDEGQVLSTHSSLQRNVQARYNVEGIFYESLSPQARDVIALANDEAHLLGHGFLDTEFILLGLIRYDTGISATVLKSKNFYLQPTRDAVERIMGRGIDTKSFPRNATQRLQEVFEIALTMYKHWGTQSILPIHLLLSMIDEAARVQQLEQLGVESAKESLQSGAGCIFLAQGIDLQKWRWDIMGEFKYGRSEQELL